MLSVCPAFAQAVTSVDPANATHTAVSDVDVTATLSSTVTSVPSGSFVVSRSQTARTAVDIQSFNATEVTVDPSGSFHPGEWIQAIITSDVTAPTAVTPYVWKFRTRVTAGSGLFTQNGNSLGSHNRRGISLGDVDGDGGLDAFVANYNQANQVWPNDGSGVCILSSNNLGSKSSAGALLGDVDGDGNLDACVVNTNQANGVWLNNGSGEFTESGNSCRLAGKPARTLAEFATNAIARNGPFFARMSKTTIPLLRRGGRR